jgi:aspartate racemase
VDLPAPVTAGLKALGAREGATLFMTLLAAFQVLLYRDSGQTDIAVGSPIAGRGRPEVEGLIGFFVNTLVLRSDLSGEPLFLELLSRVRNTALEAYTHQDLPFEKLVEDLAPARDLSRQPLFQVLFVLQNTPGAPLALDGLAVSRLVRETESVKFDLCLSVRESVEGLHLRWEYASDLFEASTIVRLSGHFQVLLEAIAADPARRIGELPLLTEVERHQVLIAWNATTTDYPRDRCVHQLFEAQAARAPEAVAVVYDDRPLTYAVLNARANQVAHHLRALGVGPEVLVGICVDRSPDLIAGLLGILKAGGAYVPLDPSYPQARVAFMLSDTQAPVLVTQQALLAQLPLFDGHVLCLDRDAATIAAQSDSNPHCSATSDTLAYVMYTSGSTGTPKGVAVRHRGIARLVRNTNYAEIDTTDCVAHISNPAFDAATFEIWGALANGASLAIIPRDVALDVPRLADELRHRGVSTMFLTTTLFNEVVRDRAGAFVGLKQLLIGGEALDPHWVGKCLRAGGPKRLLNGYGPTECTTFATSHLVEAVEPGARTIPIGRPIANTVTYVLDRSRQPVPIGVAGELYIGGAGVARGYWNRPELTTEKFVPDPFSATPGARMYRTGDRVRYLASGDLEFLGRLDDQVKIRGFRIELGEIESVLGEHPAVRQNVVLAREDTPGEKRLVAYLVPAGAAEADIESLRAFLRARQPDYMRPAAYVVLEQLPLTATGKLDRRALPAPSRGLEEATRRHELPRDDVERRLCQLWGEVLNTSQVGIDDDFFELGGHSLMAAQLFARMDQAFGRSLPLATLFDAPTVRGLARFYRDGFEPVVGMALVPITASGSLPRVFAVPGVGGNVLGFMTLARDLGPEQPFFGLQSVGLDGAREPLERIEQMAAHYLREVREIQPRGPYLLLGACFGATVAFEMTRQLLDAGEEVAFLGLLDPSSLGGDLAGQPTLPLPAWFKRGTALASFVTSRVGHYIKQMRSLDYRQRAQLLSSKLKLVAEIIDKRDLLRGDYRKFHQRRVSAANLRALRRYKHEPLPGGPDVIEIFRSGRVDRAAVDLGVDWASLMGRSIKYHSVPGKNSGDMLQGEHAKTLATLLSSRLEQARRP